MEAIGLLQSGSNDGPEPWTKYLDGEMAETKRDDPVSYRLAEIIRDTLLSTNETRAAEAAQRIDSYYRYEYLVTDPFMRFLQGRGTAPFLCHLYGLVLEVASVIPSGVPHQDVLIQLLGELHKLPPTSCMLWNTPPFTHAKEPVFATVLETVRQGYRPRCAGDDDETLPDDCDKWINLCAFIARCIRSGLLDQYDGGCGYALYDISKGLLENHPVGIMQKCNVTVAMQYLLLASSKLYQGLLVNRWQRVQPEGAEKWQEWGYKVKEIADSEGTGSDLEYAAPVARVAYDKMVSFSPY